MAVYQIIYRSTATRYWDDEELERLVKDANSYNSSHSITGVLFYADQQILQVLEGEQSVVEALYNRIFQDPRHTDVVILLEESAPQRTFSDWGMGFSKLDLGAFTRLSAYLDPQYWKDLLPRTYNAREVILDLLNEYAEGHLIVLPERQSLGLRP